METQLFKLVYLFSQVKMNTFINKINLFDRTMNNEGKMRFLLYCIGPLGNSFLHSYFHSFLGLDHYTYYSSLGLDYYTIHSWG